MIILAVFSVVVLFIVLFSWGANSNRTDALKRGMRELGNVTQYSLDEVATKLGAPNAVSGSPSGEQLVQWVSPRYHVAMSFDRDGKCLGIDSEMAV